MGKRKPFTDDEIHLIATGAPPIKTARGALVVVILIVVLFILLAVLLHFKGPNP